MPDTSATKRDVYANMEKALKRFIRLNAASFFLLVMAVLCQSVAASAAPPPAPTGVAASDGTFTNKVLVSWKASSGAAAYEVWRGASNKTNAAGLLGEAAATSYADTTAVAGTTYYYWVRARNAAGLSGFSGANAGFQAVPIPPEPAGVTASDGAFTNQVRVSWQAAAGAAAYEVWRYGGTNRARATRLGSPAATGYEDKAAVAGTNYYYWVKAKNSTGVSGFSEPDAGYRLAKPPAPTGVAASDGTFTNKVLVSWNISAEVTGYEVWRQLSGSTASPTRLGSPSDTFFDDTTAVAGKVYYYRVKAKNAAGASVYSVSNTGYRLAKPPAPTGVAASDGTFTNKVLVSWKASSGAAAYEVWRGASNKTNAAGLLGEAAATSYADTTAVAGTTYYYWVRARNAAGLSGFSGANAGFQAVPIPPEPAGVTASDGAFTNQVRVSWQAAAGAAAYEVWRYGGTNRARATRLGSPAATGYEDKTAVAGTNYYYWVKAKNSTGVSGFSEPDAGYRLAKPPAPAGVAASDGVFASQVEVSWNLVQGATGYEVWRQLSSSTASSTRLGETNTTTYLDAATAPGTVYRYWVKAKNAAGVSGFSSPDTGYRQTNIIPIENNVSVNDLFGNSGNARLFSISVPTGQKILQVTTSGGTGDCDVYVKYASWPATNSYNARSIRVGNSERAQIVNPAAGTWYILLSGRSAFSEVALQALYLSTTVDSVYFFENGTTYGYDNFTDYYHPWKSLEFISGATSVDTIAVWVTPSEAYPLVEFTASSPSIASVNPPTLTSEYSTLSLVSSLTRGTTRISARYNNAEIAYCSVATYPRKKKTVAVTLVHEQRYRSTDIPDDEIRAELKKIYMQAVFEFVLVRRPAKTVAFDLNGDGKVDVDTWMSAEMARIRDACKSEYDYNIFLVDRPSDGTTGFMNFNQKYGFVHADGGNAKTVAHELGHGTAGFEHTPYDRDNIMYNYTSDTKWRLRKSQWNQLNP